MRTLSLKLPESLDHEVASEARRLGTTKSAVVRGALELFIKRGRHGRRSCLDLAGDLIGSLDGPSDLSHNKKRLEGFGE
jgi:hypothetical protein